MIGIYQNFDPLRFGLDIAYSIIIAAIFILLFIKTKELFVASKHQGIHYLRYSFLFFSLAYISRILYHIIRGYLITSDYFIPGRILATGSFVVIAYITTIAIGYLIYSTLWRKIKPGPFLTATHLLAISAGLLILNRSIILLVVLQILLIGIIFISNRHKKIALFYMLLSLFWILNMIIIFSRNIISTEIKLVLQIASILILLFFTHKVLKWVPR